MKLRAPAFEKALKQGVRRAIRGDARIRKEYRRAKGRSRPTWVFYLCRLVFSCLLAASVSTVWNLTHHLESALTVITLWTLAAAAFLSAMLAPSRLHGSDVRALQLLPVSDFTIYRFRRDKILSFHFMVVFDVLAGLGMLAYLHAVPWPYWLALPLIAGLALVFNVALAMLVAWRFPRFRTGWLGSGIALLFIAWLLGNKYDGPGMIATLDFAAPTLNLVLPTAWPLDFFHLVAGQAWWPPLLGLVPMTGVIWNYKTCEQLVAERYPYREPGGVPDLPEDVPEELVPPGGQTGLSIGVTAISEGILSRACLALPHWDGDWPQRMLWRWFTPREQVLANMVFPRPLAIIQPWIRIMRHFLIATVIWQATRLLFPPLESLVLISALMIPVLEVLGQSCPAGAAFRTVQAFGTRIWLLAPYPVDVHGLSTLLLKCSIIQLPAVAALVTGISLLSAASHGLSWLNGLVMGVRIILVLMALRMSLLALNFGSISNDTSRSWIRTLVALAIVVVDIGIVVGLAIGALTLPSLTWAFFAGVILVGSQYAFLRFYAWLCDRGSIDLVSLETR